MRNLLISTLSTEDKAASIIQQALFVHHGFNLTTSQYRQTMQRYCQHAVFARIPFTASSIYPKAVAHPARRSPMNKLLCTNTRSSSYSTASYRHTADIIYRNNSPQRRTISDITNSEYKSEYIHPLSQIVLEHLQSTHSDWVQRMGLDKGLQVKKDGTFVLRFDDGKMMVEGKDTVESIW